MNRYLSIILSVIILGSCGSEVSTETPEQTAEAVYNVVVANKPEELKNLLLTETEIEQYMRDQEVENFDSRMAEVRELYGKLPRILSLVRTVGKQSGIDWKSTELMSIELAPADTSRSDDATVYDVNFNSNGDEFQLNVFMTETEKGWRLTGAPTASWIELE